MPGQHCKQTIYLHIFLYLIYVFFAQAQSEDQQFKINPDDLQGFWDMVTIQVEEVKGAFDDLDVLRQNNWTAVDEESREQVHFNFQFF